MLDSGGAMEGDSGLYEDEQRGSCHEADRDAINKVSPLSHLQKKTRVPLSGLSSGAKRGAPPTLQIVMRKIGTEKERFGSVSFSLKRF